MRETTCDCGTISRLAGESNSPVEYDEVQGQFVLMSGGKIFVIRHCFICGARFNYSTPPLRERADSSELEEAMQVGRVARDVATLRLHIGEPDEIDENPPDPSHVRALIYTSRWKSLRVYALEFADGRIQYSITDK